LQIADENGQGEVTPIDLTVNDAAVSGQYVSEVKQSSTGKIAVKRVNLPTVEKATNDTLGIVKKGTASESDKKYAVDIDSNGGMTVTVPWTGGTSYTLSAGANQGELKLNSDTAVCATELGTNGQPTFSKVTATSFLATSDRRLKTNIKDFASEKSILDINVKEFDLIETGDHSIGVIAQDLQEICPEIVHTRKDGYLTIEESKIVYLLLNEVKKLRKELDELKK
jgi:hypothetical protein